MVNVTKMRVLMFKDNSIWVAQGLEYDICAQSNDVSSLYDRFDLTAQSEIKIKGGIERIPPAPKKFFDMWESADANAEHDDMKFGLYLIPNK